MRNVPSFPLNSSRRRNGNAGGSFVSGFTLIEIILVVGLVAIVAAMAWPSFQLMFESAKLTDAASELRTTLREARRHAISDGVTYRCDFLPGENIVRIVPSTDPFEEEGAGGDGENPLPKEEGVETDFEPFRSQFDLPVGLRILSTEEFDAGPESKEKSTLDVGFDAGERAATEAGGTDTRSWMPLCDLHPDGSASAVTIRLVDNRPMIVELVVRPLTGEVDIGEATEWLSADESQSQEDSTRTGQQSGGAP